MKADTKVKIGDSVILIDVDDLLMDVMEEGFKRIMINRIRKVALLKNDIKYKVKN